MKRMEMLSWREGPQILPDIKRVLLRPFVPGNDARMKGILKRIVQIKADEAERLLADVRSDFTDRHGDLDATLRRRYDQIRRLLPASYKPSPSMQLLIGSYFSCEYSLEAAALFNPSIVPHPDQHGVPQGSLRFIMSLRATGEGHISSIEFRTGLMTAQGDVTLDPPGQQVTLPRVEEDPSYDRSEFVQKLRDEGCLNAATKNLLNALPARFRRSRLKSRLAQWQKNHPRTSALQKRSVEWVNALMELNYEISFPGDRPIPERVVFPVSSYESNGIEDARFVRFLDDRGDATWFATYTAYNGRAIMPLLIETNDFLKFRIQSMSGDAARNKGMALFPRKVGGRYAMISRQDAESLYLVFSDRMSRWDGPRTLLKPTLSWEYTQIGNCGSPIETERGWLLLTHGVGPLRTYCIGAILLGKEDPSRIIGQLRVPLIAPGPAEREGYVPNVVYTCGALLHGRRLIIPYAISDRATRIASVEVEEVLQKMQ